jgi:Xaa-Pro dipeptidase
LSCFRGRIEKLSKLLEEKNACTAIVNSPGNVFYFTGFRGGVLVLSKAAGNATLLVPALEYLRAKETIESEGLDIDVITYKPYGLPDDLQLDIHGRAKIVKGSLEEALKQLIPKECKRLLYDKLDSSFYTKLAKDYELIDAGRDLALLRAVKEACEIERIEEAARIAEQALNKALSSLEPGVTEAEIAGIIESEMRSLGAEDHAFPTIVAFGLNTVYPHAQPSPRRRLEDGQPVLIDLGALYKGYCSDMTRTIDYGGVGDEFTSALKAVIDAVEAAIDIIKPGVRIGDIDSAARKVLERNGLAKYFIHSLGHGVGVEVHEYPRVSMDNNDKLLEGMVITVEPGVYIPGKFGIRVEELVLVTSKGARLLTRFPRELWL